MSRKSAISDDPAKLRRRAEGRLGERPGDLKLDASAQRLLHELEVHKIELEMQNVALQKTRDELEVALENYTDLYDFAPMGYFSVAESGVILESNLTGAALLGIGRSQLVKRRVQLFVSPASRANFGTFLDKVFASTKDQECEVLLLKASGGTFWADFRAKSTVPVKGTEKWCRVVFADISARKQAEEAAIRLQTLATTNQGLNREIARRQRVEKALQKSKAHQSQLLQQSRHMQGKLRHLSHQILFAQEEERKRISRELHDKVAQTLVGIHVHLQSLNQEAAGKPKDLRQTITRTQRLLEISMGVVQEFARELRPTVLDDLGLIVALHAFMKEFTKLTGVRTHLTAFAAIEQIHIDIRTVLYRVAIEALNNVGRHSQASRVELSIEKLPYGVAMKVKDNGKSFDLATALRGKGGGHLGLLGMRERLEMVGGRFEVKTAPGQGTTITAHIPLGNGRSARGQRGGGGSLKRFQKMRSRRRSVGAYRSG